MGSGKSVIGKKLSGSKPKNGEVRTEDGTTSPPLTDEKCMVVSLEKGQTESETNGGKSCSPRKQETVTEHESSVSAVHDLNQNAKAVEVDERIFLGRKETRGFTVNAGRTEHAAHPCKAERHNSLPDVKTFDRNDYDIPEDLLHVLEKRHQKLCEEIKELALHYAHDEDLENWRVDTEAHVFGKEADIRDKPWAGERELEHYGDDNFPWSVGYRISCSKGAKGLQDNKPNQDNFSLTRLRGEWDIVCVMDGHGKDGHLVSSRAVQTVPYFLAKSAHFPDNIEKAFDDAFKRCQEDIVRHSVEKSFDAQGSGCTGLATLTHGGVVWTAHCGDSRAMITTLANRRITFETADHKPTDPPEWKRIEDAGGEVAVQHYGALSQHRVFVKGKDMPGLLMSRCLGDCCVKDCGVVATPDVSRVEIPMEDGVRPFLVMASDGIWEFLDSDWVAKQIAKKLTGPFEASKMDRCLRNLIEEARKAWAKNSANYCDDITCILKPLF